MWNRFYQLHCGIQHYPWGERRHGDKLPFIANLLGLRDDGDEPFAELWIGAHERLPAGVVLETGNVPLNELIAEHPNELLGKQLTDQGIHSLPFLLKVLSCEKPLSIQAHPDLTLAAHLHASDPEHYPDSNHKPEIAIALTDFEALCQFRESGLVQADCRRLAALQGLFAEIAVEGSTWLRQAYRAVFEVPQAVISTRLSDLRSELQQAAALTAEDQCFLRLQEQYPDDRGAFSAYFLNFLRLTPGDAVFLNANEPHAYLQGTIIECMANSDNVVRAGLTNKFVDQDVLLQMLTYREGAPAVGRGINVAPGDIRYGVPVPEFQVEFWCHDAGEVRTLASRECISVLLVLSGAAQLRTPQGVTLEAHAGSVWLWPAALEEADVLFLQAGTRVVRASPNYSPKDIEAN